MGAADGKPPTAACRVELLPVRCPCTDTRCPCPAACPQVNCEIDRAGLGSLTFNAIEFSCPVDQDKQPNIQVGGGFELAGRGATVAPCLHADMEVRVDLAEQQQAGRGGAATTARALHIAHWFLLSLHNTLILVAPPPSLLCSATGRTCRTSCLGARGSPLAASWPLGAPASEAVRHIQPAAWAPDDGKPG